MDFSRRLTANTLKYFTFNPPRWQEIRRQRGQDCNDRIHLDFERKFLDAVVKF